MELDAIIKRGARQFRGMPEDLLAMEQMLRDVCDEAGELSEGLRLVNSSGGKRLRPMLAWLCWRMTGGRGPIVPLMTMLEIMHTASLIHDDIVDGAELRRGVPTINKRYGTLAAVRSGDYLLAKAMEILKIYRGTGINEALSGVSELMSLGELRQQDRLFRTDGLSMDGYIEFVYSKTAALIAESCHCGAVAGGASGEEHRPLLDYGIHLGIAFQMRDDYIDWIEDRGTGKAPLQDVRSGVMSLPIILALTQDNAQLKQLLEKQTKSEEEITSIFRLVRSSGALEAAKSYVCKECALAAEALSNGPDGPEKDALMQLAKSISEVK